MLDALGFCAHRRKFNQIPSCKKIPVNYISNLHSSDSKSLQALSTRCFGKIGSIPRPTTRNILARVVKAPAPFSESCTCAPCWTRISMPLLSIEITARSSTSPSSVDKCSFTGFENIELSSFRFCSPPSIAILSGCRVSYSFTSTQATVPKLI
uniref:Uncharacterized protein n=1 Tax=Zea mays TaxID=4577 RepID=B8A2Q9_MAIZE|nr:unknown [Zea mays]|eukprot:NP_001146646.1 uncharacterized protein LOC100280245 [Zea mays]